MKIAILGAGSIGSLLAKAFAADGHDVRLANSRGPETIRELAESVGAVASTAQDAVQDVDVVVTSVPLAKVGALRSLLATVPANVPVVDTGNYYPARDGHIAALDEGQPEAVWISEQVGRPIARAWNAVLSHTLAEKGRPAGTPGRIAIPIASDDPEARRIAAELTEITGFDPVDVGGLDQTLRIQPGNPAYCTDLTADELRAALERDETAVAATRRDAIMQIVMTFGDMMVPADLPRINRAATRTPLAS